MVELQIVVLAVAGSSPVGHPFETVIGEKLFVRVAGSLAYYHFSRLTSH